jgi:hypothetical protein
VGNYVAPANGATQMLEPQPGNRHERRAIDATGSHSANDHHKRAGYTVKDWCHQVSISAAYFYELKNKGLIDTAKIFGKVLVLTDPREFLEQFRQKVA